MRVSRDPDKESCTHGGVSGREEDGEGGGEINVLVTQRNQHPAPRTPDLSVQHWIQDRVIALHILTVEHSNQNIDQFI